MIWTISWWIEGKTLRRAGSTTVTDIGLQRYRNKEEEKSLQHSVFTFSHLTKFYRAEQGLTLLIWWDAVLSLWLSDSMLTTVF